MKIHEKILTHYLSCTSPVDKEGYLYKKKARTTSYQRRWFVLKANLLFYQERPADRNLLGVIVLEGCAVRHCEADGQLAFSIVFQGPGLKTYRFAAEDSPTKDSWVKALLSSSHCYLSVLMRDLGKQYEEAKCNQGSSECHQCFSVGALMEKDLTKGRTSSHSDSLYTTNETRTVAREGRSFSASHVLQVSSIPTKVSSKKSPKLWPKRNAHVTPLNAPAPSYGEWPLVGSDPLEEFSKLHEYYGQEVMQLRDKWLKSKQMKEEHIEDLINLE